MKLEAFEKAASTAHEQALRLKFKARQLGEEARAAKEKARLTRTRLKLIKRQSKQARGAAKSAKRAFTEVRSAADKAAAEAASLDKKIQKVRQALIEKAKRRRAPGHKRSTAKSRSSRQRSRHV